MAQVSTELSRDWLEAQLSRQLAHVEAPDSLWTRVQAERRVRRKSSSVAWMLWPVLAMALLVASIGLFWQIGRIESSNPAELRAWVKAKTNMDVDLVCGGAGKIQFSGARLTHSGGELVAEIAYQVEGKAGLLMVSKKGLMFDASCHSCHIDGHGQI